MRDDLTLRGLNRTLLERQYLLGRSAMGALDAVDHLVGLQAQEPNWPFVGLWTRLQEFRPDDLNSLLASGQVVRSAGLRSTQHLLTAKDLSWLRTTLQPVMDRAARSPYLTRTTTGLDTADLAASVRELLSTGPMTRRALAKSLAALWPPRNGRILAGAGELAVPLVHGLSTSLGSMGHR